MKTCKTCDTEIQSRKIYCEPCRIEAVRTSSRICQRKIRKVIPRYCKTCFVSISGKGKQYCKPCSIESRRTSNRERMRRVRAHI